MCLKYSNIEISPNTNFNEVWARVYCIYTNSHLTAAVPEGTGRGADPTVQYLAGAGEGSTVPGVGIGREVGIGRQGTGQDL